MDLDCMPSAEPCADDAAQETTGLYTGSSEYQSITGQKHKSHTQRRRKNIYSEAIF